MNRYFKPLTVAFALGLGAFGVPTVTQAQGPGMTESPTDAVRGRRGRRGQNNRAMRGHRGRRGHGHMRQAFEALNLTDNQKSQIRAIRESARSQMQEGADRTARRAMRTETRRLIHEVLTPAQRSQLETLRTEHRENRQARRLERMTERLSLTTSQQARIRQILEESATSRRAARRNADSPGAVRAVRQRTRAAIERVLTPEQRETMGEMRSRRGERGERGRRGRRGRR